MAEYLRDASALDPVPPSVAHPHVDVVVSLGEKELPAGLGGAGAHPTLGAVAVNALQASEGAIVNSIILCNWMCTKLPIYVY